MNDDWKSRKLWVAILGMALSTYLKARGLIGDDSWASVMLGSALGYPAANVAQKALEPKA